MKTKIYALRGENRFVRYVGKTKKSLQYRFQCHLDGARKGDDSYKARWIRSMLDKGLIPTVTLLGEYEGNGSKEEIAWIKYFRDGGIKLTNETDGGDGNSNPSKVVRDRISNTLKQMYKDHPEVLKEMALRVLGTKHPKEVIAKMIATRNTPAARKRNSEAVKISSIKRYQDPREHEKLRVAQNKRYQDPKELKKLSDAHIKRYRDPKEREKTGLAMKRYYENPENRAKAREAVNKGWIKRKANLLQKRVDKQRR